MKVAPLLVGGGIGVGILLASRLAAAAGASRSESPAPPPPAPARPLDASEVASAQAAFEDYPPHPAGWWGPVWRTRKPHGLPADVRPCSAPGVAYPLIRALARPTGDAFTALVVGLADTESGGMVGRPANNFDSRPPAERGGAPLITAFGVYQWNHPLIRTPAIRAHGIMGPRMPVDRDGDPVPAWLWSAEQEVSLPLEMYRQIWQWCIDRRASPLDAARGVRIWHQVSSVGTTYLTRGASTHWAAAWALVPANRRAIVDRHLKSAGLIT